MTHNERYQDERYIISQSTKIGWNLPNLICRLQRKTKPQSVSFITPTAKPTWSSCQDCPISCLQNATMLKLKDACLQRLTSSIIGQNVASNGYRQKISLDVRWIRSGDCNQRHKTFTWTKPFAFEKIAYNIHEI